MALLDKFQYDLKKTQENGIGVVETFMGFICGQECVNADGGSREGPGGSLET